ncbi:unnamed protein product, partial [Larinioides sclopetarius]
MSGILLLSLICQLEAHLPDIGGVTSVPLPPLSFSHKGGIKRNHETSASLGENGAEGKPRHKSRRTFTSFAGENEAEGKRRTTSQ